MLEAGLVGTRSTSNILAKNLADMAVGSLGFFVIGWALAYGPAAEGVSDGLAAIIGTSQFLFIGVTDKWANIVFQWTFAATSTTIVSGAAAGRIKFVAYVILSFTQTSLVYPPVAHWIWAEDGWLYKMGVVDLAGDAAVHLLGGVVGFVATVYMGPRKGVFSPSGKYLPLRSSPLNAAFGGLILWWCWFAFNAGSTLGVSGGRDVIAAIVSWNTAISAGAAVGAAMGLSFYRSAGRFVDIFDLVTGLLAGLVGITAGAHVMQSWAALITGAISSLAAIFMGEWLATLGVDDPVGAVPVHVGAAAIGLLLTGVFALPVSEGRGNTLAGILYGGDGTLLGVQLLCVVTTTAVGLVFGYLQMYGLDKVMPGGVRVSKRDEEQGLDKSEHNLIQIRVSRHADGLDLSGSESDSEAEDREGGAGGVTADAKRQHKADMDHLFQSKSSVGSAQSIGAGTSQQFDEAVAKQEANLLQELENKQGQFASFLMDSRSSSRSVGTTGGQFSPSRILRGLSSAFSNIGSSRNIGAVHPQYSGAGGGGPPTGADPSSKPPPAIRAAYGSGGIYYGSKAQSGARGATKRRNMATLLAGLGKATHNATVKEMRRAQARMARQLLRLTAEMILERTQDDIAWVPIEKLSQFQDNYSAVSTANGAHSALTVEQMHPSVKKLQDHARKQHQLAKGAKAQGQTETAPQIAPAGPAARVLDPAPPLIAAAGVDGAHHSFALQSSSGAGGGTIAEESEEDNANTPST